MANGLRLIILLSTCMPMHYMPYSPGTYLAVTASHTTLILTAYRALLTIEVSGTGHCIHNTMSCP